MEYFKDCMTKEELKTAYRKWAIKLHPDRNPNNPDAEAEFKEMQAQYEERKAELEGDYSKARKGRERREQEERERQERERKEQARRKVEQVVNQARLNRQKSHRDLKAGDYIYARGIDFTRSMFDWDGMTVDDILRVVTRQGVKDECVVMIETIVELNDTALMNGYLSKAIPDGIWGGYEVLQPADPTAGRKKGKRVAKVVMFRSPSYCVMGNPMGDQTIDDYYLTAGFEEMFADKLLQIAQAEARAAQEKARLEAERKAKLLAEQQPMIDEWQPKLIEMSQGLSSEEKKMVAINNLKTMFKYKFPGARFNVKADRYGDVGVKWEDGPMMKDVRKVIDLFGVWNRTDQEPTPWEQHYGSMTFATDEIERRMSTLAKARILQQLGQVTKAFRNGAMNDEVTVSDFDWMMLHAMVGIDINSDDHPSLCMNTLHADGTRTVKILYAVSFVFKHTSYVRAKKAA